MIRITTFASGSSGNCALLSVDGVHFLLDAGISCRRITENLAISGLKPSDLAAVLITHEHSDHICGLTAFVKKNQIPIFAPRAVASRLCSTIAGVEQCLRIAAVNEPLSMGGVTLTCFRTSHDSVESVGWRAEGHREIFALATDTGCVTGEVEAGLSGADIVLIEANHDVEMLRAGPYPAALKRRILSERGHLSNENCAALAARLADRGAGQILLGHLSRENNTPAKAYGTVAAALEGRNVGLFVAPAEGRMTLEFEREMPCLV